MALFEFPFLIFLFLKNNEKKLSLFGLISFADVYTYE